MKKCTKCKKEKALTEFYFSKSKGSYYMPCKVCSRKVSLASWNKNYTPEQKRKIWKRASRNSMKASPEKWFARRMVIRAMRHGVLIQKPCFVCEKPKTDAHHEDYSKPLEVIWLCRNCHIARHFQLKQ